MAVVLRLRGRSGSARGAANPSRPSPPPAACTARTAAAPAVIAQPKMYTRQAERPRAETVAPCRS